MTATKFWYINCDGNTPACHNEEASGGEGSHGNSCATLAEYRAKSRRDGWTGSGGKDYCPGCSEYRAAQGEEVR